MARKKRDIGENRKAYFAFNGIDNILIQLRWFNRDIVVKNQKMFNKIGKVYFTSIVVLRLPTSTIAMIVIKKWMKNFGNSEKFVLQLIL